jgi:hypothetical protein
MWGVLSDERTGLSFTIASGPLQRSHSRVRVPRDSWLYFTVSDSRLPFSSPPATRRATLEVFDPASTRGCLFWPPLIASGEPNRDHRLQGFQYCQKSLPWKYLCHNVITETLDSKQPRFYSWLCYLGNVFTEPLPSYTRYIMKGRQVSSSSQNFLYSSDIARRSRMVTMDLSWISIDIVTCRAVSGKQLGTKRVSV